MEREVSIPLGVIVARKKLDNLWVEWSWKPIAVVPGAGPVERWNEIASGEGWTHFHAATVPLTLYRSESEAYNVNLNNVVPAIYVVLRKDEDDDAGHPYFVHEATASPYDAQAYLDSDDDIVEAVPMPPGLVAWIKTFVDEHHVEEVFVKRKRTRIKPDDQKFGKEPIFGGMRRMGEEEADGDE